MTLGVLLAHVAARWAVTPEATAHGWAPDESETEMTEHLHHITHTHDAGYGVRAEFTCTGDRTSPCHQYPPAGLGMETWGETDRDLFVPHDECWIQAWMDEGCSTECGPNGEPVRSGPITVTWGGDCVEWKYAEKAAALTERTYTLANMARARREGCAEGWEGGYRARGADAIYTGLTGRNTTTPNPYEQATA